MSMLGIQKLVKYDPCSQEAHNFEKGINYVLAFFQPTRTVVP